MTREDELLEVSKACRDFTIAGAEPQYPPDLTIEPVHLDIALTLDVARRGATARVVTSMRAAVDGARRIALDAVDFEDVVVSDEAGRPLSHSYDGRKLTVLYAEPLARGEERRLAVSYRVERPVSGLHFGVPDAEHGYRAHFVATDHETERARYWLPCVDLPAVRTTLTFAITAPAHWTVLANGLPDGETADAGGAKTTRWRLDYPCPSYLLCFAAGEFVRYDDVGVDGRPIAYFGLSGRCVPEDLRRTFGRTPSIMRWIEKRLGVPFPFPKYFQFAAPKIGGAMENISLVSWDDDFVLDETLALEMTHVADIVNVHEMAHSYFGDAVVIRDFAHAWLKESWATYVEDCWLEDNASEDEARYHRYEQARAYMEESDENYSRPIVTRVFNSSWDMYDRHLYPGGARRIHMLRRLLGERDFWAAVRDYLVTFDRRTVETDDFRRVLEKHSGLSLGRFFDQWFHGKGYPKLKVAFAHDAEKGTGRFTVEQTQTASDGKSAPFAFPLVLAWETAEGVFERRAVSIEKDRHEFLFPMPKEPLAVRVDPDGDLLCRLELNPGDGMLRRALTSAPDVEGRILAAQELAKTAKTRSIEAVGAACAAEPFWGVRREMARAIADTKSAAAIPILARLLETEKDPRVLGTVADRAGEYRDPRVAAALRAVLDRTPPYLVRRATLVSLGRQRDPADFPRLLAAARDDGWRSLVRAGGLRALAEVRTEEAFAEILARTGYAGERDDTAHVVPEALARSVAFLEKRRRDEAVERLSEALRDPREWVRLASARALGALRAPQAASVLEAAIPTFAAQMHPRLRRILTTLRDGDGKSDEAKRKKDFEDLTERQRKLEERMDRLEAEKERQA